MLAVLTGAESEAQFAALVDTLAADGNPDDHLTTLLREDLAFYNQRGTATTVRMRGWVLLALARVGVTDAALRFVLEELDTGTDAYLVAAAARALRSYPRPSVTLVPFVLRAIANIRYQDGPVSFDGYGAYAMSSGSTTPVLELLATLAWLGPHARTFAGDIEALNRQPGGLPKKRSADLHRALQAIRSDTATNDSESCCALPANLLGRLSWALGSRRSCASVESIVFEDHNGQSTTFRDVFQGHPSIVTFFYTRCDNPLKCSLTVTKLARLQGMLRDRGLADRIHTAAITYDPSFDLPERLRVYGRDRGVRLNDAHRMLRAIDGIDALRDHFRLGVNFVGSLINRHRIEVYILDGRGQVARSFERLHWDEREVVDRAVDVLMEASGEACSVTLADAEEPGPQQTIAPVLGTIASFGVALLPKCPLCVAAYLSAFGIATVQATTYAGMLQPLLVMAVMANLVSVWLRGRSTGQQRGLYLVSLGACLLVASQIGVEWGSLGIGGAALTSAGSLVGALSPRVIDRV